MKLYRLTLDQPAKNTPPSYNVCPTDPVDTIVAADGKATEKKRVPCKAAY